MLQTSLLLMKSLNKTETPIFLSVVCSLFPKAIFLTFIILNPTESPIFVIVCVFFVSKSSPFSLFVYQFRKKCRLT